MSGYVFDFKGHGCFSPNGKIDNMTPDQIASHNRAIAVSEMEAMAQSGKALLYLHGDKVGTWDGSFNWSIARQITSKNNWGATRIDVWFTGPDGKRWHGVNLGDNDMVRAKRNKGR